METNEMNANQEAKDSDSRADAVAALLLIVIAVASMIYFVSNQ